MAETAPRYLTDQDLAPILEKLGNVGVRLVAMVEALILVNVAALGQLGLAGHLDRTQVAADIRNACPDLADDVAEHVDGLLGLLPGADRPATATIDSRKAH